MSQPMTPQQVAEAAAKAMYGQDTASRQLGMHIESVGPGRCVMSMTVTAAMVNGLGTCHGGYMFALADSTMAFASNSFGTHSFAQNCAITYLRPGRLGDLLVATAQTRARAGRTAMHDITVARRTAAGDEVLAEFRGHTRDVEGSWV